MSRRVVQATEGSRGQGVLCCASHSSAPDPLTTNRRKTHPPDHQRKREGRGENRPLIGNFFDGGTVYSSRGS
jgi:hypothetical protein